MTSKQRIQAFSELAEYIKSDDPHLEGLVIQAKVQNPWFTKENIKSALNAIANNLKKENLTHWLASYATNLDGHQNKKVGLILAGNIPLVGFHDILCTLITGFNVQVKLSSDDKVLIPHLLSKLCEIEPLFNSKIEFVDRLKNFDIIIATGSNNTSRYFEYYFKDVPHIIRKNRNGVAILSGKESKEQLKALGHDIFDYFGLGCRNVSKIYFPTNYHYPDFFEAISSFSKIADHFKYHNNYEFNKSIYLVNGDQHLDNGFLLLKKDERLASPLGVVYYEEYDDLDRLLLILREKNEEIQCIISSPNVNQIIQTVDFGESQSPKLDDYADGVDTVRFLIQQIN